MSDPGLTEATQRVSVALNVHYDASPHCGCGWREPADKDTFYWGHMANVLAEAAREDVADLIRQSKADALEGAAHDSMLRLKGHSGVSVLGLLGRAEAIREGRES